MTHVKIALQEGSGKIFPGVQDALGVQHRLDALHDRKLGWAAGKVHEVFLDVPDAVLSAQRAPEGNHFREQLADRQRQRVVPRRLVEVISEDVDVQVAVAGVAVTDGPEACWHRGP